jgi:hypothetical protein
LLKTQGIEWAKRGTKPNETNSPIETKDQTRGAKIAVGNSLLGCCVECTANVDADDERLRWCESASTIEELSKRTPAESLTDGIDILLAIQNGVAMIEDSLDTGVAQTGCHVYLALKCLFGVGRGGGAKCGVDEPLYGDYTYRNFGLGGQVSGVKQHHARHGLGFKPQLVELVAPTKDGAGHVLWVSHDP